MSSSEHHTQYFDSNINAMANTQSLPDKNADARKAASLTNTRLRGKLTERLKETQALQNSTPRMKAMPASSITADSQNAYQHLKAQSAQTNHSSAIAKSEKRFLGSLPSQQLKNSSQLGFHSNRQGGSNPILKSDSASALNNRENEQPPTYLTGQNVPFWNKLPQLINELFYWIGYSRQSKGASNLHLDYDPFCLKVLHNRRYAPTNDPFYTKTLLEDKHVFERLTQKEMSLESFKMTLEQVPGVKSVEFSGRGEPMLNPELFEMIRYAKQFSGAHTTVITEGHLLSRNLNALANSPLDKLVVKLYGHKPSFYHQMSGLDAKSFLPALDNLKNLMRQKRTMNPDLLIWVSFTVDIHTFRHIPELIAFAYNLGIHGVIIENYLSVDPDQPSERSLYKDQKTVVQFLSQIHEVLQRYPKLHIQLPALLERNMQQYRNCRDAFTTVTVDGSGNTFACSRQMIHTEENPKIWDADFWNHQNYQSLRAIHSNRIMANQPKNSREVPVACQHCPHNIADQSLNHAQQKLPAPILGCKLPDPLEVIHSLQPAFTKPAE